MPGKGGEADQGRFRVAELVATLSLGIDLGFGQPMEHALRQCLIALKLAERAGLDEQSRATVYYTALLVNIGCHTDAHEQAKWFGDDIAMKSRKYQHDSRSVRGAASAMRFLAAGHPPVHRFRLGIEFAISGHRELEGMIGHHAAMTRLLAEQLGMPAAVLDGVGAAYERWDGRGWPGGVGGDDIPVPSRIAQLAEYVEVAHRVGGVGASVALARQRSGTQFDPMLASLLGREAADILAGAEVVQTWDAVIAAEPALAVLVSDEELDAKLCAVANFVDLKSPYMLGHSAAVADLAAAAGSALDFPAADLHLLRRAGLVSGFGRLGISNAIWDKPGPLGPGEWERARMQPYFTERMLRQSAALAPLGALAVQHRERLDGSGYPRGISGGSISPAARVLAAADAYQAMQEPRPHRAARSAGESAGELRADVRSGRLDRDAVEAVLSTAGHQVRRRAGGVAGLTAREVEVLRLAARGLPTREIAQRLVMSPKTASNHIEHIYAKIGATNRAAASLFAVRHGLLPEHEPAGR
jgi:HD-GYP domain-containing protein (c-di-GMP phosphodiesterase class II)